MEAETAGCPVVGGVAEVDALRGALESLKPGPLYFSANQASCSGEKGVSAGESSIQGEPCLPKSVL